MQRLQGRGLLHPVCGWQQRQAPCSLPHGQRGVRWGPRLLLLVGHWGVAHALLRGHEGLC